MKNTHKHGYIRQLDSYGRFQLPKEIRELLHLQTGDLVEVCLLEHGIYLEKYQLLQTLDSLCEQYLSVLHSNCNVACAICNTEHFITSKGIHLSSERTLSKPLKECIHNLDTYCYSEESPIPVFDDGKYLLDAVYPIGTKEIPIGAVILLHYRNTTLEEKNCAKLIADLLTKLTINN